MQCYTDVELHCRVWSLSKHRPDPTISTLSEPLTCLMQGRCGDQAAIVTRASLALDMLQF